ncbi:hypothetical protein RUM43_008296 [Polyplax serrata]|uniref:Uncharacterized protein n=1 Tax=Polyplax serrata TaxID=468196 RepID=A0AAN8P737_POLSC
MSKALSSIAGSGYGQKSSSTLKLNQGGGEQWPPEGKQDLGSHHGDSESDLSESDLFLAKGAFLLTPSYELSIEKASSICEKMNFKSSFSLTKTATGILFKFENPEDYQAVFKKAFHKVTGARFYKKIPIPCRPQKTFTIYVYEIPDEVPEEDIRHALYKFHSIVELARISHSSVDPNKPPPTTSKTDSGVIPAKVEKIPGQNPFEMATVTVSPPSVVRITLASLDEANYLLENGLDFYGATYFPTETLAPTSIIKEESKKFNRFNRTIDYTYPGSRVQELLPVFDSFGFKKLSPPTMKTFKPPGREFGKK